MIAFLIDLLGFLKAFFRSRYNLGLEILALRQQLGALKRKYPRPRLRIEDRIFWVLLRRLWPAWGSALVSVKRIRRIGCHFARQPLRDPLSSASDKAERSFRSLATGRRRVPEINPLRETSERCSWTKPLSSLCRLFQFGKEKRRLKTAPGKMANACESVNPVLGGRIL